MTTTENSTQPAAETTEAVVYGPFDLIDVSGAQNRVYLIPAAESDSGKPEVFVWGNVGAGAPERAWHNRWLCLGRVSQKAVPPSIEAALREHQGSIVEISGAYRGAEWNGNNHVGTWAEDFDSDVATQEIEESLGRVETYCAASDYYAPVTLHEVVDCDLSLEELVAREVDQAAGEYALEPGDVSERIEAAAKDWLESNSDPSKDDERNAKMRVRLLRLLGHYREARGLVVRKAKKLAEQLYRDDLSRTDEVAVETDGHKAYAGWLQASQDAGDHETRAALEAVDSDAFAAQWNALVSAGAQPDDEG